MKGLNEILHPKPGNIIPLISSLMLHTENILPIPAVPIVPNQAVQPVKSSPVAQTEPKYEEIQVPQVTRPVYSYQSFKANFPMVLATLINEKKIDQNYIDALKKHFGVKEIWNVMGSEAQCLEIFNTFGSVGLITKVD